MADENNNNAVEPQVEEVKQEPKFIHLNVRSKYSVLEGLCDADSVLSVCKEYNMPAVAITNKDNIFDGVQFTWAAGGAGIQPIIGQALAISNPELDKNLRPQSPFYVIALVQNEIGYKNFMQLTSQAFINSKTMDGPQISLDYLLEHNEGIIILTGSVFTGPLAYFLKEKNRYDDAKFYLAKLKGAFGDRVYVELQRHGLYEEKLIEADLINLAYELDVGLVATNEARFMKKEQSNGLEVMMAIHDSKVIADETRRSYSPEYYFKTPDEMCELFTDIPEATENTIQIAKRCGFHIPTGHFHMPAWQDPSGDDETTVLERMSREGFEQKLKDFVFPDCKNEEEIAETRKKYEDRLAFELKIINQMGFPGYFLVVSDFCKWSLENGVPVGPGRGSGAGSIVAWVLDITGIDPIRYGLFFERFLNPERVSLPDFDIDFCQENRHKTIEYVQKFYGYDRVCAIITFGKLKAKGCIRDVGRVLGLGFGQVSKIAGLVPDDAKTIEKAINAEDRLRDLYDADEDVRQMLDIAMQIEGSIRQTGVHAAGVIISPQPIVDVNPLFQDPGSDVPATQFEGKYVEPAGMVKFDFLGLKTLTTIKYALDLIHEQGIELDIRKISLDDDKTYDLLCEGDSVGVFQVESPGMQDLLKRLQPHDIEQLSAQLALYRPGPLESGMLDDFVECRHGRQDPHYPHPCLEPILKETFGVILYQEQVMQIAQKYAGYTLGGADMLRRAMGKKKPEEMAKQTSTFVEGAKKTQNVEEKDSKELFSLIEKFAGYGFNKAHSLAYAFISYQTAYLKANYREEFMAASMSLDRGNPDKVITLKEDLDFGKVPLLAPCINHSTARFEVEQYEGVKHVRFALNAVKGSGDEPAKLITEERKKNGKFKDIFDVMERLTPASMNKRLFETFTYAGAFDCFGHERGFLIANMNVLLQYMNESSKEAASDQMSLFGSEALERPKLKNADGLDQIEQLELEEKSLGFFLSDHPLSAYAEELEKLKSELIDIKDLEEKAKKSTRGSIKIAGAIADFNEKKTQSGGRMGIVKISDFTGVQEVAIFPNQYESAKSVLEEGMPIAITARLKYNEGRLSVMAENIEALDSQTMNATAIRIRLNNHLAIAEVANLLEGQQNGGTACFINYNLEDVGDVVIKLAKYIKLNRKFFYNLKQIEGIELTE
ncbi:MAG TPA: DNA polymerase III subunit alpha [Alphaproteobacteria bacterium]|nr:DNA polymerase III subunit alpha [Alphaproteobacteria bacterium]